MQSYHKLLVGDYVRVLCGPSKNRIYEITSLTFIGVYVRQYSNQYLYQYLDEVEYVTPEEAMLYKLENA